MAAVFVSDEEIAERLKAGGTAAVADLWLVSGTIVSGWNGPTRWAGYFTGFDPQMAEEAAHEYLRSWDPINGRRAVLWVSNVITFRNGYPEIADRDYATFADDPMRPADEAMPGGYTPPPGFEGWVDDAARQAAEQEAAGTQPETPTPLQLEPPQGQVVVEQTVVRERRTTGW